MKLRKLANFIAIAGGIALAIYGTCLLFGLSELSWGKHSRDSQETNSALITVLIGVALAAYGWFDSFISGEQ